MNSETTLSSPQKKALEELKEQIGGDYQDNTHYLRNVQNSWKIRTDILRMEKCKRSYKGDIKSDEFREMCIGECSFLYNEYTYLFNKLLKDVLDLKIMFTLLQVMQNIENGSIDQEGGSIQVGKILKDLYLDCATREGEQRDKEYEEEKPKPLEGKAISWKAYKNRGTPA